MNGRLLVSSVRSGGYIEHPATGRLPIIELVLCPLDWETQRAPREFEHTSPFGIRLSATREDAYELLGRLVVALAR